MLLQENWKNAGNSVSLLHLISHSLPFLPSMYVPFIATHSLTLSVLLVIFPSISCMGEAAVRAAKQERQQEKMKQAT